jgi:hypothetical protein
MQLFTEPAPQAQSPQAQSPQAQSPQAQSPQVSVTQNLTLQVPAQTDRSSPSKGKKFNICWGSSETHQWAEYNTGSEAIHINGKTGPVLHLYRGSNYFFCVDQAGPATAHAFILTNSPSGGPKAQLIPGAPPPTADGCVAMFIDATTPRYFYYQDAKAKYQGGLIIVHDK